MFPLHRPQEGIESPLAKSKIILSSAAIIPNYKALLISSTQILLLQDKGPS